MEKISGENMTVSKAVTLLTENKSNMLQFHVFADDKKTKPVFAAFFILGEDGEPQEAIDTMTGLKTRWSLSSAKPKIEIEGVMETSYLIQQLDLEGPYAITRDCESLEELYMVAKQCGIGKLMGNQRIIKRIDIPLNLSIGEVDEDNPGKSV
jgi:hypothetical protein